MKKRLAIFASGSGSNAVKIHAYFKNNDTVEIACIVSNKPTAGILSKPAFTDIPKHTITRTSFYDSDDVVKMLVNESIDLIILAGFLWKIPANLIQAFPNKIINIHPALLPNYGGKGMYGQHVHQAVFEAKETESGMTIHYVNEHYDEGAIIFQAKCNIEDLDSAQAIGARVLRVEHQYFAQIIEEILLHSQS